MMNIILQMSDRNQHWSLLAVRDLCERVPEGFGTGTSLLRGAGLTADGKSGYFTTCNVC